MLYAIVVVCLPVDASIRDLEDRRLSEHGFKFISFISIVHDSVLTTSSMHVVGKYKSNPTAAFTPIT